MELERWFERVGEGMWQRFVDYLEAWGAKLEDIVGAPEAEIRGIIDEFLAYVEVGMSAVVKAMVMKELIKMGKEQGQAEGVERPSSPFSPPDSFQEISEAETHIMSLEWITDHKKPIWAGSPTSQNTPSSILSLHPPANPPLSTFLPTVPSLPAVVTLFQQHPGRYVIEEAKGDAGTQCSLEAWNSFGLLRYQVVQYE